MALLAAVGTLAPAPAHAMAEVCSDRQPVCLTWLAPPAKADELAALMRDAELAMATLPSLGLGTPKRRVDGARVRLDGAAMLAEPAGCAREIAVHRALLDAALEDSPALPTAGASRALLGSRLPARHAQATLRDALLPLATPCALGADDADWARAQHEPAHGWPQSLAAPERVVAARWLDWLDRELGAGGPGRVLSGFASQLAFAELWTIVRHNSLSALFSRSDERDAIAAFGLSRFHPPSPTQPQARVGWDIDWPRQARALLVPTPLTPLGSSAIRVRGAPAGSQLRVELSWEQHLELRVAAIVRSELSPRGRVIWPAVRSRVPELNVTIELDDAPSEVLLVLTSVGDPFEPPDTRLAPFEPHAALVTLAAWGANAHAPD